MKQQAGVTMQLWGPAGYDRQPITSNEAAISQSRQNSTPNHQLPCDLKSKCTSGTIKQYHTVVGGKEINTDDQIY